MKTLLLILALSTTTYAQSACDVIEGTWNTQPSLHRTEQLLTPSGSGRTSARTIFDQAISRLKTLVTLYQPSVWPYMTVSYAVDGTSAEWRPLADMSLTFNFGPWGFQGSVPIHFSQCTVASSPAAAAVQRVQFDLRRATGDLADVVGGMRINFSIRDVADFPGAILVASTVGILPGRNYGNHGVEIEDFLRKQIYPFMNALRTHYENLRQRAEALERH